MDAIDPREGVVHTGMRERPLTAAILSSAPRGPVHRALWGVVDAALPEGRVTASALHILLDFVCERHLGGINATKPPSDEPIAVAMAQASEVSAHIWVRGTPVPTPAAARFRLLSGPLIVDPVAMAAAQAAKAAAHVWVRGTPVSTPLATRIRILSGTLLVDAVAMAAAQAAKAAAHVWVRGTPVPTPLSARIGIASSPQPAVHGQLRQPLIEDSTTIITLALATPAAPATPAPQTALGIGTVGMGMGGGGFSGGQMGGAAHAPLAPLPPLGSTPEVWAAPTLQLAPVASPAHVPPLMLWQSPKSASHPNFGSATDKLRPTLPPRRRSFSESISMYPGSMSEWQPTPPRAPKHASRFRLAFPAFRPVKCVQPLGAPTSSSSLPPLLLTRRSRCR